MVSSASLKDLSRVIHAFLPQPTLPLPENVLQVIAGYLERHEKYDDAASDRLQEELLSIFDKHVRGNSAAQGPWIAILRRLLPVLKTPERILPWFDTYKGLLDNSGVDGLVVDETIAALVDLVTLADACHDSSPDSATNPIIDRLLFIWMARLYSPVAEGNTSLEHNKKIVRQALITFGKKRPHAIFTSMNDCLMRKSHRHATLRLFCDFIQAQPPHLHQVLHTSIFSSLLTCLQKDTSTTVVSSALTVLIMLLPHMPSSLVPHLPTLFNIYARLLFWDREKTKSAEPVSEDPSPPQHKEWESCDYDPELDALAMPQLPNYYTILYGLYPINFMDYIRKPQRYLRHANISNSHEVEVQSTEIRHRSERFRRCHLLHPNFYTLTIDSEKTDFGRWIKSEAAEVLVCSTELCQPLEDGDRVDSNALPVMPGDRVSANNDRTATGYALPDDAPGQSHGRRGSQLTNSDSETSNATLPLTRLRRSTQEQDSPRVRPSDSPTIPAPLTQSLSQTQLQDLINSNKAIKSGLHQSIANDSVQSLALSHNEFMSERPAAAALSALASVPAPSSSTESSRYATALGTQVAHLQKRVLVLENDLSFERYVKHQHVAHIGELRRRQVVEAATEAETQNLVMMNRNLKSRFEDAKKAEKQVRRESEKSRALAKKWESDLANKLKILRDESKKTSVELDALKRELTESKHECEKLRKLVCEAEFEEINRKQSLQSVEIQEAEMARLRARVEELSKSGQDNHARQTEREAALSSVHEAKAQVELMKRQLTAQEHDAQRTNRHLQAQLKELQSQLAGAQEHKGRLGSNANVAIEGVLAASRAKQAELQRQYSLLTRKYTALQSSLLDMQLDTAESSEGPGAAHPSSGDHWSTVPGNAPASTFHPRMSESDAGAAAFDMAAPIATRMGSAAYSESERRGSAPDGIGGGAPAGAGEVRHFGGKSDSSTSLQSGSGWLTGSRAGGLPSWARKDGRDRAGKDDAPAGPSKSKKEKKASGLRGMRGLI